MVPQLQLVEPGRAHGEWVRQVSFYASLHCVVSCATCADALLMCDVAGSKTHNMFRVDKVTVSSYLCYYLLFKMKITVILFGTPVCILY